MKNDTKKKTNRKWRKKNPDYFKARYQTYLKPWLEKHPGYLKDYCRKKREQENTIREKPVDIKPKNDIQDELGFFVFDVHFSLKPLSHVCYVRIQSVLSNDILIYPETGIVHQPICKYQKSW